MSTHQASSTPLQIHPTPNTMPSQLHNILILSSTQTSCTPTHNVKHLLAHKDTPTPLAYYSPLAVSVVVHSQPYLNSSIKFWLASLNLSSHLLPSSASPLHKSEHTSFTNPSNRYTFLVSYLHSPQTLLCDLLVSYPNNILTQLHMKTKAKEQLDKPQRSVKDSRPRLETKTQPQQMKKQRSSAPAPTPSTIPIATTPTIVQAVAASTIWRSAAVVIHHLQRQRSTWSPP